MGNKKRAQAIATSDTVYNANKYAWQGGGSGRQGFNFTNLIYMNNFHDIFLRAIHDKEILELTINSKEKWVIIRNCAPLDFWPHANFHDKVDRYMLYHFETKHPSPMLPEQILECKNTWEFFEPKDIISWNSPYNWHIDRDWWIYS